MNETQAKIGWPGWEIVRSLGGGSFGTVFEMQRNVFGTVEKAALKVISVPKDQAEARELLASGYGTDSINRRYKADLEDIVKEYQLMSQLKGHSNVVHCEDLRYEPQPNGIGWNLFIKMELLQPLQQVMTNPIRDEQVIRVGMDLCNALIACKNKNIIHRDIKPANIMVSTDGTYKLGDFGVAKTSERTSGGTRTGTPNYMAPEVYHNQPYGPAVDQYSLGMVMYWMLNERCIPFITPSPVPPTSSQSETAMFRRLRGEPLPPPVNGSPALKQVVLKACAYNPKDRYSSPEELYNALSKLSAGQGATYDDSHRNSTANTWGSSDGGTMGGATFGGTMVGNASVGGTFSGNLHDLFNEHTTPNGTAGKNATFGGNATFSGADETMGNSWDATGAQTVGSGWNSGFDQTQGGATVGAEPGARKMPPKPGALDISSELKITAAEAAAGCSKLVEFKSGRKIKVTVPAGIKAGQTLRIEGQGKTDAATGAKGTLYLKVVIDQKNGDFWKEVDQGAAAKKQEAKAIVISPSEAKRGCTRQLKAENGFDRTLVIPAGCQDGQNVDSVKVYVHNASAKTKVKDLENLPDVVLREYTRNAGAGILYVGAFILWGVFGMTTMLIPVMAVGLSVTLLATLIWHRKWNVRRNEAKRLLKLRENGSHKHK